MFPQEHSLIQSLPFQDKKKVPPHNNKKNSLKTLRQKNGNWNGSSKQSETLKFTDKEKKYLDKNPLQMSLETSFDHRKSLDIVQSKLGLSLARGA